MPLSQRGLRQSGQLVGSNGMQNKYVAESLDSGVFMHMGNQQNTNHHYQTSGGLHKTNRRGGVNQARNQLVAQSLNVRNQYQTTQSHP